MARNLELGPYFQHRLKQADQVAESLAALRQPIQDRFEPGGSDKNRRITSH